MTYCNARVKCKEAGLAVPSSSALFKDFQNIQAICAHPMALWEKKTEVRASGMDDEDVSSNGQSEDSSSDSSVDDSETDSDVASM